MSRLPDWEARLLAYIAGVMDLPHVYGQHDCFLHCWAAVEAVTGVDHASQYIGRYDTAASAAALLRSEGEGTLLRFMDRRLARKPIGKAGRGDIVMVGKIIGVCMGANALFVGDEGERKGLVTVPRGTWDKAWANG